MVISANHGGTLKRYPVENETGAVDQGFLLWRRSRDGCLWLAGPGLEIDGLQSCLQVEFSWPAIFPHPIPVKEPIGNITCLLDLGDKQAGPNRVNRAGRNQYAVTDIRFKRVQYRVDVSLLECHLQFISPDPPLEPCINTAFRFCFQDNPGLGFAPAGRIQACCLLIVGVNLDREVLLAVQVFKKQGEGCLWKVDAEQGFSMERHQFVERHPLHGTVSYVALVVSMVHDFPALGDGLFCQALFPKQSCEPMAAPDEAPEKGPETNWLEKWDVHGDLKNSGKASVDCLSATPLLLLSIAGRGKKPHGGWFLSTGFS